MKTLVFLNLISHLTALGVVAIGAYLITHDHSTAGGWTIAFGTFSLIFGGYSVKSKD